MSFVKKEELGTRCQCCLGVMTEVNEGLTVCGACLKSDAATVASLARLRAVAVATKGIADYTEEVGECAVCDRPACHEDCIGHVIRAALAALQPGDLPEGG